MATLQQPQQPYNLFGPQMFEHQGKQAQYQTNTVINQSSTDTSQPNTNTATANNSTPQEAQFKLERDHQGNYYTNGVKTPMHVFNPDAVPYIKDEQQQNNKPITSMEELARAMGYTSPEDERKMRRASLMNQRILAVGDALRHIGNIANTVGYAPAQQFNNPVLEEQARYEKGKAIRDRANQQYIAYQQAKAKQDAEQKRWEAEQTYKNNMLQHYRDQDRRLWERDAETARRNAFLEGLKNREFELKKAYQEGRIGIAEYNAQTARIRAMRAGANAGRSGGKSMDEYTVTSNTEYTYGPDGTRTGSKTTKTRTVNGKQQPTQTKTSTTPKKQLPKQSNSKTKKSPKRQLPK